jgi:hypothetical protein
MMPKEYLVLETIPKLGTGKADFAKTKTISSLAKCFPYKAKALYGNAM